ncbi:MAG TPA: hypothetical protein DIU28_10065, partial [Anabaena sp. UBA12330]|nr:hypothetical protein [Anabaena sp. UBA12330]
MANNFVWVNATTLNGTLWDNGTLSSVTPITQIGTLTISGGYNSKYLNAQLNNTGTIVDTHFNYLLYFQNGAILNNSGIYELQQGLIDNFSSSSVGTFNNSGTFKKTTANTATIGVAFNNTGTVNVESGTLNLYGGGVSNGGTFNLTSGQNLEISNSVYTFSNGAKINGSGNLLVSGGTLQADGNWTLPTISTWYGGTFKSSNIITNSGTLTISGGYNSKYLNAQLNNTGTIVDNHSVYYLYFQNGAILNNSGIYELQQGSINNSSNSSVGTFNNSGTFKKTTADTATIGVAFNNTGTVNVEAGTLTLSGGGVSNGGTFNLTSGQTLQIDNSVYTFSNGTKINGSGKLLVSGGTLQADENWTLPTISTWYGGTFKSSNIITNSGTLTIVGNYNSKYLN